MGCPWLAGPFCLALRDYGKKGIADGGEAPDTGAVEGASTNYHVLLSYGPHLKPLNAVLTSEPDELTGEFTHYNHRQGAPDRCFSRR